MNKGVKLSAEVKKHIADTQKRRNKEPRFTKEELKHLRELYQQFEQQEK